MYESDPVTVFIDDKGEVTPGVFEYADIYEDLTTEYYTESPSTVLFSAVQTETPAQNYGSSSAGLVIGILLTIISFLIGAILYVVYQVRERKIFALFQSNPLSRRDCELTKTLVSLTLITPQLVSQTRFTRNLPPAWILKISQPHTKPR